jgi:methylenetetrahydrofolate--tRNA-(uracil-5-)-methyltransferase
MGTTMNNTTAYHRVLVVGGGLAGSECALALARAGIPVRILEMRPLRMTPAHQGGQLAELVCSNSLRSNDTESAVGRLKAEMRALGSAVIQAADATRIPAGKALAVDRELFAAAITRQVQEHPLLEVERRELISLEELDQDPELADFRKVVLAAGPLASEALGQSLAALLGQEHLYFYDAIAPIVSTDSINMERVFWASRYQQEQDGEGDYLNCPMSDAEYHAFRQALLDAHKVPAREFEKELHFEGCMPVEALAERGELTLAYGPLKPVGLVDPRTGKRPFAVLQLRPENATRSMLNLVGCQTKLTYPEQERVFRLVPGLENAEFVRLGSMHRNTFVNAPRVLGPHLDILARPSIHLAGQITGVEGYVESAACGLWLGLHLAAQLTGKHLPPPPEETALGALLGHLRRPVKHFQPSNVNFGLSPDLAQKARKRMRKSLYAARAAEHFDIWLHEWRDKGSLPAM